MRERLINYCFSVAGIVGLMMCKILNVDNRGFAYAIDMGIGMQLTNISKCTGRCKGW